MPIVLFYSENCSYIQYNWSPCPVNIASGNWYLIFIYSLFVTSFYCSLCTLIYFARLNDFLYLSHIFLTDESSHSLEIPQADSNSENQPHTHDVNTEVKLCWSFFWFILCWIFCLNLYRNYIHGIMHFVSLYSVISIALGWPKIKEYDFSVMLSMCYLF
jgi:hypothetical protein